MVSVSLSVPSRYYTSYQYHYLAGDHTDTNVDTDIGILMPIPIIEIGGTLVGKVSVDVDWKDWIHLYGSETDTENVKVSMMD